MVDMPVVVRHHFRIEAHCASLTGMIRHYACERAFRGSPEPGADVIREVTSMSAPADRTPLSTMWSEWTSITREAAHTPHPTCLHLAPMPTAACDQARYVRPGRPFVDWLEAYSASRVVASDPAGSVDLVPVLLPASMGA